MIFRLSLEYILDATINKMTQVRKPWWITQPLAQYSEMGAGLLSFGLERGVESYRPEKRKISINPVWSRI